MMKASEALEIANKASEHRYEETYKIILEGIKDAASNGKYMYEIILSLTLYDPNEVIKTFRNLGYGVGTERIIKNDEYFTRFYIRWDL